MNLNSFPENSGVYIFRNAKNEPIYIGKSSNIKKRLKSHFDFKNRNYSQKNLISKSKTIETLKVDSEIEALLLEANLIKKYKPIFNIQLKDDKDYLYIKITDDVFPKVLSARKKDLPGARSHFGPFPSSAKVRTTLKTIRRIFPYSTCRPYQKRTCLYFHLGLCPGVCAGTADKSTYKSNINKIKLFLEGDTSKLLLSLEGDRKKAEKILEYEQAGEIQRKIEALHYITKPIRFLNLDEPLENIRAVELSRLAKLVKLNRKLRRIECYDVSNFQGKDSVGSMVVFIDGAAEKAEYRKFRIKSVKGISDVAMISEVIERRFKNAWGNPDLIVIDGGKPQLTAASEALTKSNKEVKLISLAKRLEEIYVFGDTKSIRLQRNDPALKLVQRLRDEAHRFAITYHKKLRAKEFLLR